MKKRVWALLLSVILMVTALTDSSYGKDAAAGSAVEAVTEESTEGQETAETKEAKETTKTAEAKEATETAETAEAKEATETVEITADMGANINAQAASALETAEATETKGGYIPPQVMMLDSDELIISESAVDSTGVRASSAWDKYAANYYYNLMNEEEREFYDALDDLAYSYLTTNRDAPYTNYLDGICYGSLSSADAGKIWSLFRISNPQYYFLLSAYGSPRDGSNFLFMGVYPAFSRGRSRSSVTIAFENEISSMLSVVLEEPDDAAREKKIHDLIVGSVMYDPMYYVYENDDDAFWQYEVNEGFTQSAFSVFGKAEKTTVCAGYSMAFELLCNAAGIENISVTSSNHQWNRVRLNGSWYNVDCTWDDYDGDYGIEWVYRYFNRSTEKYREMDTSAAHNQESIYNRFTNSAVCTLDSGATMDSPGTIADAQGAAAVPVITDAATGSEVKITLSSPAANAKIYYTTDGTTPSVSATKSRYYNAPFTIRKNTAIKAIAVCDSYTDSAVSANTVTGCTIRFDSQGGSSVAAKYTLANTAVTKPANPTRTGYTFGGWYTDSTGKTAWNFASAITASTTLYAKWAANTYTITYNLNKGKNSTKNPKSYTIASKTTELKLPTRSGYAFSGWYKDSKFKTKITQIKAGSTGNLNLYAKWTKVSAPKQAAISKLSNKAGKNMAVTVKKISGVAGYQVRYSVKSNMKNAKTKAITSTSVTLKNLSKKTYYVQVRAYKTDSKGKKYYGKWSKTKMIKIQK